MGLMKDFLGSFNVDNWLRKTFLIDMEDKYTFESDKNFVYPNAAIICDAIRKYGEKNNEKIDFVSEVTPVTFWLNQKEKYRADVIRGMRCGGYILRCTKIED